jgi:hypothetical protein
MMLSKNVIIILLLCIIVGACIIGLNIAKTQVPYTDRECNDVQVPYTDRECSNVQIPYSAQDCQTKAYAYNGDNKCTFYDPGIIFSSPAKVVCTINNLERQPGTFSVTYGFVIAGKPFKFTDSLPINALSSISRTYTYNGQIDYCTCDATPPTYQNCLQVTKYRTETQCHDITKYRTENQCHDLTKFKTVSIWQSLFG